MAGGELLDGEGRPGATGHGFPIREHLEKEEDEAITPRAKTRSGKKTTAVADDGAMAGPNGAQGEIAREHHLLGGRVGEREEAATRSPRREAGVAAARNSRATRGRRWRSGEGSLRARVGQGQGEKKRGRGKMARVRARG